MHESFVLQREHCTAIMSRRTQPYWLWRTIRRVSPNAQMIATSIAVETLLPIHVFRRAVQQERHHRFLRVAAVVEHSVKVVSERVSRVRIGIVPARRYKRCMHLSL